MNKDSAELRIDVRNDSLAYRETSNIGTDLDDLSCNVLA